MSTIIRSHSRAARLLGGASLATVLLVAAGAQAQTRGAAAPAEVEDVIVPGSSIRGAAPVGSNLIAVGQADIEKTGAQTIQQVLRSVPSVVGMGAVGQGGFGSADGAGTNAPTIHGLGANGINYADWALGQFFQRARQSPWFQDTLFVMVGDHGFGIPPVLTRAGLLHQHVPLLFYGPGVLGETGEVRHVTASQMDILPSILGLLGSDVPHQSYGRNLFALPPNDSGHAYVKASGSDIAGYIEGHEIITLLPGKPAELQTFDLAFPPTASDDLSAQKPERAAEMERRLKALIVTGLHTLKQHRAGIN